MVAPWVMPAKVQGLLVRQKQGGDLLWEARTSTIEADPEETSAIERPPPVKLSAAPGNSGSATVPQHQSNGRRDGRLTARRKRVVVILPHPAKTLLVSESDHRSELHKCLELTRLD